MYYAIYMVYLKIHKKVDIKTVISHLNTYVYFNSVTQQTVILPALLRKADLSNESSVAN